MALDGEALGQAIVDRIDAAMPEIGDLMTKGDYAAGKRRWYVEIATAIVEYLQTHAEVTPAGSPPMEADGQPVTGKGRIT